MKRHNLQNAKPHVVFYALYTIIYTNSEYLYYISVVRQRRDRRDW